MLVYVAQLLLSYAGARAAEGPGRASASRRARLFDRAARLPLPARRHARCNVGFLLGARRPRPRGWLFCAQR
ncbi:MAG: hypothetical protein MZW92_56580 [Comamonadaceae bacterium]|nr:hypothetical protein [Comamonadaceae bacterium]